MRSLVLVALVACGGKHTDPPPDNRTLFERLGGQPAINAVVHEFVQTTKADPRISQFFANADSAKLEASMDVHICSITGGGCTYTGKSMLDAHTGMHLPDDAFTAFMDDLTKTLAHFKVPKREAMEVIGAFNGMKPDVVNH
ncbi:MAG: group 1 truncated hemoglobin [Kofleriaceae bacterium]